MVEVRQYHLFPTDLIPNSPRPLLHYKNVLTRKPSSSHCDPAEVWDMFTQNGWKVNWIFRYSETQLSHYHSKAHECMAVLSGTAKIRFGVADTSDDLFQNTRGSSWEEGGVELEAEAGDVFIIPAGVAHKTYDTKPEAEFKLLTPGTGHGIEAEDPKNALADIQLSGYTMMGAYSGGDWDFIKSGGDFERVWAVPKPSHDPFITIFKENNRSRLGGETHCWIRPGPDAGPPPIGQRIGPWQALRTRSRIRPFRWLAGTMDGKYKYFNHVPDHAPSYSTS